MRFWYCLKRSVNTKCRLSFRWVFVKKIISSREKTLLLWRWGLATTTTNTEHVWADAWQVRAAVKRRLTAGPAVVSCHRHDTHFTWRIRGGKTSHFSHNTFSPLLKWFPCVCVCAQQMWKHFVERLQPRWCDTAAFMNAVWDVRDMFADSFCQPSNYMKKWMYSAACLPLCSINEQSKRVQIIKAYS